MIRILDNYVVIPEAYDYMLAKDTVRVSKKTGAPDVKPLSYHGSLRQAIVALRKVMVRKSLSEVDGSLSDALNVIQRVNKRFEAVLNKAMEESR